MSTKTKAVPVTGKIVLPERAAEGMPKEIDLSEPALKGEALKASEIRYRRLFETAQDGILIIDAHTGRIEDANPVIEDMLGYLQTELVGKALWEIGLFKNTTANQLMYQELKKNGYVRYEDLPLQTKGGEHKQVEFVSNIYPVDDRNVIQCNNRDITARKIEEDKASILHEELVASLAELKRHDQELQSLYKMNDLLQSCNTRAEAYQVISLMGAELFNGQKGCLAIFNPLDQYLEVVVCWGDAGLMKPNFLADDCWALRRGHLHLVEDPRTGMICNHFPKPVQTGYLCVPLMVQGEILGVLSITYLDDKHIQRQQPLTVIVGDAIKLSLSNLRLREKLREQALTDQLTGLGNRYYLEDNLSRELAHTLRRDATVCVALLDIDHFKKFNDSYGHEAGDMLLRRFGEILREHLRQGDLKCRYGGEEFVVVLIDTTLAAVLVRLEKISEVVRSIDIQFGQEHLAGVTVSIGVVEAHDNDWTTGRLLRAADEALYTAKQAGRDRIVVYPVAD